ALSRGCACARYHRDLRFRDVDALVERATGGHDVVDALAIEPEIAASEHWADAGVIRADAVPTGLQSVDDPRERGDVFVEDHQALAPVPLREQHRRRNSHRREGRDTRALPKQLGDVFGERACLVFAAMTELLTDAPAQAVVLVLLVLEERNLDVGEVERSDNPIVTSTDEVVAI